MQEMGQYRDHSPCKDMRVWNLSSDPAALPMHERLERGALLRQSVFQEFAFGSLFSKYEEE